MNPILVLVLLIFGFALLAIAAGFGGTVEPWRNRIAIAGLAFWAAAEVVAHIPH